MDSSLRTLRNMGLNEVHCFLRNEMDLSNPLHLADIIRGCGGTLADLASDIVKYLGTMVLEDGDQFFVSLRYALAIMSRAEAARNDCRPVMLSAGIISTLTTIESEFSRSTKFDDYIDGENAFASAFEILGNLPSRSRAIRIQATLKPGHVIAAILQSILNIVVRQTVYGSVLSRIQYLLLDVNSLVPSTVFQNSEVYPAWLRFTSLVEERLTIVRCSGEMNEKSNFGCCGDCHIVFYCSPHCQRADWRAGGHREVCKQIRAHSFPMLLRQLIFMRQNPGVAFATVFNYALDGICRIEMALHLLVVSQSFRNCCRILPMRLESASQNMDLDQTLLALVEEIPPDTTESVHEIEQDFPAVIDKLQALRDREQGFEIH
ncbi:hypothetical protein C8R43DRAFT_963374 [Mycena crocata]|nr:hypothetical protein C8R43DRAFT_963374 [Mycena crocata]